MQVSTGQDYTLVRTSTGQLFAFGTNDVGQLGIATNSVTTVADPSPSLVSLPGATGSVADIAAGANFSLVVTTTGQLYSFGINYDGELGISTNAGTQAANPAPARVSLPGEVGPVTQVSAGRYYGMALTATGQLYAFGDNYWGELGISANEGTTELNATPALVTLPGATGRWPRSPPAPSTAWP